MRTFVRVFGVFLLAVLGTALVVGSGGGGGGDSADTREPLVTITGDNSVTIAGETWLAVGTGFEMNLPLLEADPYSLTCDNAPVGTVVVNPVNDTTASVVFNNCVLTVDTLSATVNGAMTFEAVAWSPDPFTDTVDAWSLTLRLTFDQLTVNDGTSTFTADGTITARISTDDGGVTLTTRLTGSSLSWWEDGSMTTVRDFTFVAVDHMDTSTYTYRVQGEIEGTAFGGRVVIATTTTFTGDTDGFPYAGSMTITGADNTSVTLTALDAVNIRLDVDDGSGVTTVDTTWAALVGL